MTRIRRWSVFLCLTTVFVVFGPSAPAEVGQLAASPRVRVEPTGNGTGIWVETERTDGSAARLRLRTTGAVVVPGPAGRDPSGRAAFATWDESETGRWYSYSRDGGATWSDPERLERDLLLHDAATAPGRVAPAPAGELNLPTEGRLYLVQFRVIGIPEWRQAVRDVGAELFQYFPHNAHLVRMDPALVNRISRLDFVERVLPYHPAYRLETKLRDWTLSAESALPDTVRRVRVVTLEPGVGAKARIAAAATASGAAVTQNSPEGHVIELEVTRESLKRIAAHDDVMWIDSWMPPEGDMDLVRIDSGTEWVEDNLGYCGQGVRAEILDSGIEETHQDFAGVLLHGPNSASRHGTQVYGVLLGDGDRGGGGMAAATGQLPCAEQGISADHEFLTDRFAHTQALLSSPYFASFQSNSWGNGTTLDYTSYSFELDDIVWQLDLAITQSQSNTGTQQSRPQAWSKNAISVGGIQHMDTLAEDDDAWNSDSSIGPAADGRVKPDLSYWNDLIYTTDTGNGYSDFGGTSSSTPEVAGVLGILLQMWSENVWGTNPTGQTVFERRPHFSTIKALLINNAQQYDFNGQLDDLSRFKQGWGRPSAKLALERASSSFVLDESIPLEVGESTDFVVNVAPGETELKITMVYPDPPGTTSATLHRINDLDLELTSPAGVTYHGNAGLLDRPYSDPSQGRNSVDTVENVFLPSPEAGIWEGRVTAVEVNQDAHASTAEDDAAFALVVTGGTGAVCGGMTIDFSFTPQAPEFGDLVQFNSTVAGGPGPHGFEWDLDGDGEIDSTDANPSHTYVNFYSGDVTMSVRDANGCPASVTKPITVDGPSIELDAVVHTIQIRGNSNGSYDPGEIWAIVLRLANNGTQDAEEVSAKLELSHALPGTVVVLQDLAAYGDIPAGGTAIGQQSYRVRIGRGFPCGEKIVLDLREIASTTPEHVYPEIIGAVEIHIGGTGPAVPIFADSFESDAGWTPSNLDGEWETDLPAGLGGPSPDPSSAFDGSRVLGNDLIGLGSDPGNYEPSIISTVVSPSIDASQATGVEVRFARWLNVAPGDQVLLKVRDGTTGPSSILINEAAGFNDSAWSVVNFDISAIADGSSDLRFEFAIGSDGSSSDSGWNVDDFLVTALTPASCEPYDLPGAGEVEQISIVRDDEEEEFLIEWTPDCAGGTAYTVYRGDLFGGYASAEPLLCDLEATSLVVPDDAGDVFFFVTPSDGVLEGSSGMRGDGTQRPQLPNACYVQDAYDACAD